MPRNLDGSWSPDPVGPSKNDVENQQNYWDPISQSWKFGRRGVGPGGFSTSGSTNQAPVYGGYDPSTNAPVGPGSTGGKLESEGSWGGWRGKMVDDGQGGLAPDFSQSGALEGVSGQRSLGEMAANREAYDIDYGVADRWGRAGSAVRAEQVRAGQAAANAAMGIGTSPSQDLGRDMQRQALQAQQAAAFSTRGGAMAQMAALRSQQSGQGAFMSESNAQLAASRADEMGVARAQRAQMAGAVREQDATSQGYAQQQAERQADMENWQREQNQRGQLGYESQGARIDRASTGAAQSAHEIDVGLAGAAQAREQAAKDRQMKQFGAAASAGGALLAGVSDASRKDDKKDDDDFYSDIRAKQSIGSLAGRGKY